MSVTIRPFRARDARAVLELYLRNREFLAPFDPIRPESFYTAEGQAVDAARAEADREADRGYGFVIVEESTGDAVGRISLSNVVRGAWDNATLGYFVDGERNGRGYATQAVRQVVGFAFSNAGLHRVQAAVMPTNVASARVLQKNGFRCEGRSPRYLRIAGAWEDHDVYAVTAEEWPPPS
ncbi:MAG TPA: GNAT family protein [Actinomycetota bacterium]